VIFFVVGCRLFSAGVMQIFRPEYTAVKIFELTEKSAFAPVRELGFANVSIGLLAMLSLPVPSLRFAAALSGGLFFLLTGIGHILRKGKNADEWFAMVSDMYACGTVSVLSAVYLM
jgi:hypothetical protein